MATLLDPWVNTGGKPLTPEFNLKNDFEKDFAAASEAHLWTDIWSALTDVVWYKIFEENDQFYISSHMYTYRAAGDFCAMLNQHGNYLDHYCSSRPGVVTPAIEEAMKKKGWLYHKC